MDIHAILSSYIEARDNARKNTNNLFVASTNPYARMDHFNRMVNAHHAMLFEKFPTLNLAELEALSELVNSRLAFAKMQRQS